MTPEPSAKMTLTEAVKALQDEMTIDEETVEMEGYYPIRGRIIRQVIKAFEASPSASTVLDELKAKVEAKNLRERLATFNAAMLAKFIEVEHKHRGKSVTDDEVDWLTFDWRQIEAHFWEEIDEVKGAMRHGSSEHQTKELIDVANMAFLLWWKERHFVDSIEAAKTRAASEGDAERSKEK